MYDRSDGSIRHSAYYFPTIFINNYATRLREGRQNALLRAVAYQFSMRRFDNYFPLPDPFHAVLSKTAGLGDENLPARAHSQEPERALGDRDALLSKLHLPCALSYTDARRHGKRNAIKNLKRRQSNSDNLSHGNYTIRGLDIHNRNERQSNTNGSRSKSLLYMLIFSWKSFPSPYGEYRCILTPY